MIPITDRRAIFELLKRDRHVDLGGSPRGARSHSHGCSTLPYPVIKHDKGLCHTYIDADADLAMAAVAWR